MAIITIDKVSSLICRFGLFHYMIESAVIQLDNIPDQHGSDDASLAHTLELACKNQRHGSCQENIQHIEKIFTFS